MKNLILALGLLCAANAHAIVPTGMNVSGTVTAVKEHSIEIDGKSYPIDVQSSNSSELANVAVGDKVSIDYTPAKSPSASAIPPGKAVNPGVEVVNPATAKLGSVQVRRASVTKPN